MRIQTILHATDFSPASAQAFEFASALARDCKARMIVVHAIQPPTVAYQTMAPVPDSENYHQLLHDQLHNVQPGDSSVPTEHRLEDGDPADVILRHAHEADLVVMGTLGRTGLAHLLMGSVAEKVVRGAPCPVLTLKPAVTPAV